MHARLRFEHAADIPPPGRPGGGLVGMERRHADLAAPLAQPVELLLLVVGEPYLGPRPALVEGDALKDALVHRAPLHSDDAWVTCH